MPKYKGIVGYITEVETSTDIYESVPVEKERILTLEKNSSTWNGSEKVNYDVSLSNRLSFIADPFARTNYQSIRYIIYNGAAWDVLSIDISNPPRIFLTIGGIYNGKRPS